MGIFSKLFGSNEEQEPQPQEAPEIIVIRTDTDDDCFACSGGIGDGICNYHQAQCYAEEEERPWWKVW